MVADGVTVARAPKFCALKALGIGPAQTGSAPPLAPAAAVGLASAAGAPRKSTQAVAEASRWRIDVSFGAVVGWDARRRNGFPGR
jgi:hypothetical protein